jgi:hypothetical protein
MNSGGKNPDYRLHTPVIPVLRRLKQEDREFKASLGYRGTPCLKTT